MTSQADEREVAEERRLREDRERIANWKRWGPYLSERQWGTVREDYSPNGDCWDYFPHDHARSRAYRWGEDGLAGVCDRQGRLCFSLALWNTRDAILKERLFGLTGPQGNHGEDVKELYYYLDATPTHSYLRYLYKYPQQIFPYRDIEHTAAARTVHDPEYELEDTGVLATGYWDVEVEYAKASPNNLLVEVTVTNRGLKEDTLHVLPTLWYRNTWVWGCTHEGCGLKPKLEAVGATRVRGWHESLGNYLWAVDESGGKAPLLFTENETNTQKLFGVDNYTPYVKDAFHRYLIDGEKSAVNPKSRGTKVCSHHVVTLLPGASTTLRSRLWQANEPPLDQETHTESSVFGEAFTAIMKQRKKEADVFYSRALSPRLNAEQQLVARQAMAGLVWTKQFYHYIVKDWLGGDQHQPPPPESRRSGRNSDWGHLYNRDIISMPDKWEYPWYASWDLAFHVVAMAIVDTDFAKDQLLLFLREWYMHPNGQIPAYEFALGDVNPPVHAWAVMNVFRGSAPRGSRDTAFLARAFNKLSLNFTWWVNRKDPDGRNLFGGGFLGLDNIGVFDRSRPLPVAGQLEQADGTAWMAFFCVTMLDMALVLAEKDPVYEDMASKYFEHFILIVDAINSSGQGRGLWDDEDGFYYDYIRKPDGSSMPLKIRSLVGLVPLFAVLVLVREEVKALPGFYKRASWLIQNRPDLASRVTFMNEGGSDRMLLAVPTKVQLLSLLRYLLDESEFLSPHGIRSLSKVHQNSPFVLDIEGERHEVSYVPGESNTYLFGGNSNWRGPIWLPMNFLILTSLKRYYFFYGKGLQVECPTGSGNLMNLEEVSVFLARRLVSLFLPGPDGARPCHGASKQYRDDPAWRDLLLFHEFFHGESGRGCGASHQTGWTALVANCLNITLGYSHAGLGRYSHKD
ncbi:uncharacterized protein YMR196W-like [Portunus trituberculatus]|uniref:uncharacterized protein YMR196W-like n=1 Tax=Portunus trituberculatus TaxID=210409 RepID=UPI001E1D0132|nr:uncharacterized protein YMR196W-like [Portunus trituberculatus]XP_045111686.1 uncharacterized protein YMR196W-like [Portunus trituberculatus]